MSVKIITDSACDLSKDLLEKYDIDIVPILVLLNDKEYLDSITIKTQDVFDSIRNGVIPKTSQATQSHFEDVFSKYVDSLE